MINKKRTHNLRALKTHTFTAHTETIRNTYTNNARSCNILTLNLHTIGAKKIKMKIKNKTNKLKTTPIIRSYRSCAQTHVGKHVCIRKYQNKPETKKQNKTNSKTKSKQNKTQQQQTTNQQKINNKNYTPIHSICTNKQ